MNEIAKHLLLNCWVWERIKIFLRNQIHSHYVCTSAFLNYFILLLHGASGIFQLLSTEQANREWCRRRRTSAHYPSVFMSKYVRNKMMNVRHASQFQLRWSQCQIRSSPSIPFLSSFLTLPTASPVVLLVVVDAIHGMWPLGIGVVVSGEW